MNTDTPTEELSNHAQPIRDKDSLLHIPHPYLTNSDLHHTNQDPSRETAPRDWEVRHHSTQSQLQVQCALLLARCSPTACSTLKNVQNWEQITLQVTEKVPCDTSPDLQHRPQKRPTDPARRLCLVKVFTKMFTPPRRRNTMCSVLSLLML